jgi:hypothetical protein
MSNKARHLRALIRSSLAVVAFAAVAGAPASAPADAYGYSENDVTLSISDATKSDPRSSLSSNEATFGGFGTDKATDPNDARQAESGPGPFPGENSFPAWGRKGEYARADSQIRTKDIDIDGSNVAETFRTTPGFGDALAGCSIRFRLTQTGAGPIGFILTGHPVLSVSADKPGEFATAAIFVVVTLRDPTTGNVLFSWEPNGTTNDFTLNAGVVTNVTDPFSLNKIITAVGGPDSKGYAPGPGTFRISYRGSPNQVFDAAVTWTELVDVSVPEPSPIAMVGLGLAIVCSARWLARARGRGHGG